MIKSMLIEVLNLILTGIGGCNFLGLGWAWCQDTYSRSWYRAGG